jgi:hypothetical protein
VHRACHKYAMASWHGANHAVPDIATRSSTRAHTLARRSHTSEARGNAAHERSCGRHHCGGGLRWDRRPSSDGRPGTGVSVGRTGRLISGRGRR